MLTARTEQAKPHRQGWGVRRWALLVPILVLAATGCAPQGTGTPQAAAKVATSSATVKSLFLSASREEIIFMLLP